jgi:hypothetical protein
VKANLVAVIALGTALLFQSGCTKAAPEQTKSARIREIDTQLANWASTGRSQDANRRVALRAERAQLAAEIGYSAPAVMPVSPPVAAATPVRGAPYVVTAQDSAPTENRWQSMSGDASWMDTSRQTRTHGRTTYGSGYYYENGRRVYYNNYP